jgi:hypothetical protein
MLNMGNNNSRLKTFLRLILSETLHYIAIICQIPAKMVIIQTDVSHPDTDIRHVFVSQDSEPR